MTSAVLVRIAEGIKNEIAGESFGGMKLKPIRSYADWDEQLKEETKLRIDVVPVIHRTTELMDRGSVLYVCDVQIGIRSNDPNLMASDGHASLARIDRLVLLVEQINEFFIAAGNGRKLANITDAAWRETAIRQTYVRNHLREWSQFTSIIQVTYQIDVAT